MDINLFICHILLQKNSESCGLDALYNPLKQFLIFDKKDIANIEVKLTLIKAF